MSDAITKSEVKVCPLKYLASLAYLPVHTTFMSQYFLNQVTSYLLTELSLLFRENTLHELREGSKRHGPKRPLVTEMVIMIIIKITFIGPLTRDGDPM